jgi:hypothetical protein
MEKNWKDALWWSTRPVPKRPAKGASEVGVAAEVEVDAEALAEAEAEVGAGTGAEAAAEADGAAGKFHDTLL